MLNQKNLIKVKRKNWWNRLFHPKKVKANQEFKKQLLQLLSAAPKLLEEIGDVTFVAEDYNSAKVTGTDSLQRLLELHKEAWTAGFQNKNLGPDPHGLFRTKSIADMRPQEVFLGGTHGLWGNPIPTWEEHKEKLPFWGGFIIHYYLSPYQIVLKQYKTLLSSNIKAIEKKAKSQLDELKKLGY